MPVEAMFDRIGSRRAALSTIGASSYALLVGRPAAAQSIFPGLTKEGQQILSKILNAREFTGRIDEREVGKLQKSEKKTAGEIMLELLPVAQAFSRPPISSFRVGSVLQGASGGLYLGANLEISGQSLGFSVHAEQAASSRAYMHGEAGIAAIAVTAAPCGHCRQFLEELSPGGELEVLVTGQRPVRLKSLLPSAFGPKDLGFNQGALPVKPWNISLVENVLDPIAAAALSAACNSYAPYTKAHSGVAVRLADGAVHNGSYIENVAFNPSLPPLQVALISIVNSGKTFDQIREATLVELENGVISQKSVIEATLSSIQPTARLRKIMARLV